MLKLLATFLHLEVLSICSIKRDYFNWISFHKTASQSPLILLEHRGLTSFVFQSLLP